MSPSVSKEPSALGPPVINLTEPLIVKVKKATQYRGPPEMAVSLGRGVNFMIEPSHRLSINMKN